MEPVYSSKQVICFSLFGKKKGIENLLSLFDNEGNTLMTFSTFMQKYNVKSNFLQYYSLLSAIPREWKTMLKQECLPPSTEYVSLAIEKLTWKTIYNTLLNHQPFPPPTAERRLIERGFSFKKDKKSTRFLLVSLMR